MARAWVEDRRGHTAYQEAVERAKAAGRKPPARWRVRWYDPDGKARAKAVVRKPDADALAAKMESELTSGAYRAPEVGRIKFSEAAETWFAAQSSPRDTTRGIYRSALDVHVLPRWGETRVDRIRRDDIATWLNSLSVGASQRRQVHGVLSRVLEWCVPDRIPANPAKSVPLAKRPEGRKVYLTAEQVEALADAAEDTTSRVLILVLAYVGVRLGEAMAVKARNVDLKARRVRIESTLVEAAGGITENPPKNGKARTVPLPASVASELEPLVKACPAPESYVFRMPAGTPLRQGTWRRIGFGPAVASAELGDLGLTPHSLRHTAASLAIAEGADIKVVQTMLGHASATMTWDRYGHLFPDRLDEVAGRLDKARIKARKQRKDREGLRSDEK